MSFSVFLLLLASYTGFSSEATPLTQSDAHLSVAVGQTTSISCTLQGVEFISGNHPSWYRQRPGNPPQPLIYNSRERASGIPDRFSGETYGNRATLSIARVQADDEGDYYCALWHSSASYVFGGGTQLTVTGGQPSPPTVNLYCPSKEEMTSKGTGTLVCSITGFSPSAIETAWVAGGTPISNGVQTTKPIKDNDKYMASSYLPVTAREWERGNSYTCKVRHEEQDYMKSVSQSQCP